MTNEFEKYISFDSMVSTNFIMFIYILAFIATTIVGLGSMVDSFFTGLMIVTFGNLTVRLMFEWFIVQFKINENLTEINKKLEKKEVVKKSKKKE